ncbi:MAG: MGH1-like glycoside hydrolase domain-containing protein [Gemmatimonadales bacterium]
MSGARVALLSFGSAADAAGTLLTSLLEAPARRLTLDDLPTSLSESDVLWVHTDDEPPPLPRGVIMPWVERGGRLLLTQRASGCVAALGLERDGPNDTAIRVWRHEADELWFPEFRKFGAFPHIRGLAGFGSHPLFDGSGQGIFVWAPSEGERYVQATYARGRRPGRGGVVACERSYIHVNPDRVVAWEYPVGHGGVLCVGAFVVPGARDPLLARQLRTLLTNALAGDAIPHHTRSGPATCWPPPGRIAREDPNLVLPDRLRLDGPLPGLESPLHVESRALTDEPVMLAGRRMLVVGGEQRGIREIWIHPYRALQGLTVTIGGETPLVRDVQITPTVVQRHLVSRARIVEEAVSVALEHPIALLDYRPEKIGRARGLRVVPELALRWRVDLRRVWPYPAGGGGDLRYRVAPEGGTLLVTDATGMPRAAFQPSRPVEWRLESAEDGPALLCELRVELEAPLRLAVLGGTSRAELDGAVAALGRQGVQGLTAQRQRHEAHVREHFVRLRSPDEGVNRAFEWAKLRLDSCFVDTPGVGRGLVAGYAASRPGWGDGRPGYAWYFGRDACWTAMALLAAGDSASCRMVLRFLGATQDGSGKVIHEYSTSGLAHHDAADSTPLYLLLAGRYAAWTGDLAFLEERWPELERAYRFCLETDTDDDGLIENSRVGHGWIEMGPLSGAHVTLYLASVWVAALTAMEPVARGLGRAGMADELAERAARGRAQIAKRFRTGDGYALGLLADGTPQRQRTALTAVALLLDAVDPAPATAWFDAIESPEFSTPWGVRLLSRRDALYSPTGYHSGAVWPLYTGWVSLAEYAGHRGDQAYAHIIANAFLPFQRGQGMFDGVLNGDTEEAVGVCPDQAWSAAMLVTPLIEGMLGARPDAMAAQLSLAPHLPKRWSSCEWRGLYVGLTSLDVRVSSQPDRVTVALRRTAGGRLAVTVSPALPPGRTATEARVDDTALVPLSVERMGCRHAEVRLELSDEHEVEIWHRSE